MMIIFIWLLSILSIVIVVQLGSSDLYLATFLPLAFLLALFLVFCLSVLRVLIRSGPKEGRGRGRHINQSKLKAFYVVLGVLVVLVFKLVWDAIASLLTLHGNEGAKCVVVSFTYWTGLPSSLLMPVLYLQRKWK